jgi:hypothetical protein
MMRGDMMRVDLISRGRERIGFARDSKWPAMKGYGLDQRSFAVNGIENQ